MLIYENIILALTGLKSNKMRALLTMLGIIIGIASVIAIMTVGNSLSSSITSSMSDMGANNLTVGLKQKSNTGEVTEGGMRFGAGFRKSMSESDYITDEMIDDLMDNYGDSIDKICFTESVGSGTAENGASTASVNITGENQDSVLNSAREILAGRDFLDVDQEKGKNVAVVADLFVEKLLGVSNSESVGQVVNVDINGRYYNFTIIGVYEYEDSGFSSESSEDTTTTFYIPYSTAKNLTHSVNGYSQFTVVTKAGVSASELMENIETYLNHFYTKNENYQVSVSSMEEMLSSLTDMLSTVSIAISIIAGISLLVGGIGVMNIMLVSITERTREIGTRKALGATNGSIRLQFIMESIVICLLGGFIGIVTGLLLGSVASKVLGYSASPSIPGIVFSVIFSILIGVFFGYYPANKAAKMNPIEALRYE